MEDLLHSILKISLLVSLPYIIGLTARAWWHFKFSLLCFFGFIFVGVFLHSVILGGEMTIGPDIERVMTFVAVFTTIGYLTGPSFIKYLGNRLETLLASDEFDPTYREYAKRHKTAFANDDKKAFHDFFQSYQAETKADSRRCYQRSSTSYEEYSQYRRSQSRSGGTAPPPQPSYKSEKEKMFDTLEVSDRNASSKEIKSAYRKLAWKYHPDVLAKNELSDIQLRSAEERMQDINRAYDWLKDNGFAE